MIALLLGVAFGFGWNGYVSHSTKKSIFTEAHTLPKRNVGVLLGTSKYVKKGKYNLYYTHRIKAAAELFALGRINYVLVSGDNATLQYNEPTTMKKDLVAAGIPEDKIVLDYAGFRTLDSMVRSKEVFGQNEVVVISQKFHVERALFIAHAKGIKAIGYCADDVDALYGLRTRTREYFARIKVFIDLYITRQQPKFLGDPVLIPKG